jgi:hypothetical protein
MGPKGHCNSLSSFFFNKDRRPGRRYSEWRYLVEVSCTLVFTGGSHSVECNPNGAHCPKELGEELAVIIPDQLAKLAGDEE